MAFWLMNNAFDYQRPSRINDQHFGLVLEPEDMVAPLLARDLNSMQRYPGGYLMRPWRSLGSTRDAGSTVSMAQDQFEVNLDVQQFKPEEISVKVTGDDVVIIEGKHEEKQDEHGYISRQFVRRYALPKGHDASKIESKLSLDGVLTVTAPRMAVVGEEASRKVPIIQTGEVFQAAMEKKTGEEKKYERRKLEQKIVEKIAEKVGEREAEMKAEKKVEKEVEMKVQKLKEMEKVEKEAEENVQLDASPMLGQMEKAEKEAEMKAEQEVEKEVEMKVQKLKEMEKVEKEAEEKVQLEAPPTQAEMDEEADMEAKKKALLQALTNVITPKKVEKGVKKVVEPEKMEVAEPKCARGEEAEMKEGKEKEAEMKVQKLEKIEKVEKKAETEELYRPPPIRARQNAQMDEQQTEENMVASANKDAKSDDKKTKN